MQNFRHTSNFRPTLNFLKATCLTRPVNIQYLEPLVHWAQFMHTHNIRHIQLNSKKTYSAKFIALGLIRHFLPYSGIFTTLDIRNIQKSTPIKSYSYILVILETITFDPNLFRQCSIYHPKGLDLYFSKIKENIAKVKKSNVVVVYILSLMKKKYMTNT